MKALAFFAEFAPGALDALLDAAEADPRRLARVRALLAPLESAGGQAFLSRRRYAERVDLAVRTVDALLARGLPHVGRGRLLRIDVAAADLWLRANLAGAGADEASDEDREIERIATENAQRGAA